MDSKFVIFLGFLYLLGAILSSIVSGLGISEASTPSKGYVMTDEEGMKLVITSTGEVDQSLSRNFTSADVVNIQGNLLQKADKYKDMLWKWVIMDHDFLDNPAGGFFRVLVQIPMAMFMFFLIVAFLRKFIPFLS